MANAPVQVPLRRKYTVRKIVKQVSSKGGGNTASLSRNRTKHLPPIKGTTQPHTRKALVIEAGTGKRRWVRD